MDMDDFKAWLGGFGCFALVIILILLLLVLIPICMFVGAMVTGGLIWLGWNLAIAPIFGMAAITYWWQAWGLGLLLNVIFMGLRGAVKAARKSED